MDHQAIVIGGSAGGVEALDEVLTSLPAGFPLPVLVVQHRLPAPDNFLTPVLNESCQLVVKEVEDKEPVKPGTVYVAPANYHLLVERDRTLSLSVDAKVSFSRPSIDVLFETAADVYRADLIGIILTGANDDGTAGLRRIKEKGGLTIAQDPAYAEYATMPLSAIRAGIVDRVCSLSEITSFLVKLSNEGVQHE